MNQRSQFLKTVLSLVFHCIIVFSMLYILLTSKVPCFYRYYTNLSNILAALASLVCIVCHVLSLIKKKPVFLRFRVLLQYAGACATALTSVTVFLFLSPMHVAAGQDYFDFFMGEQFHTHFLNCLLSGICCAILPSGGEIRKRELIFGVLPSLLYSAVYMPCVLSKIWPDFYGFTFDGKLWTIPFMFFALNGISWLFAILYRKLHNRLALTSTEKR